MASWIKRRYLDLAWWSDGVPPLRLLKCRLGRHCPIDTYDWVPDPSAPGTVYLAANGSHCAYCGAETDEPEG